MLTKEERAAIVERLKNASVLDYYGVCLAVTGKSVLDCPLTIGDIHDMRRVILELCDTSNMVELPRSKDGEVIRVGDTLYYGSGTTYQVKKIIYKGNEWEIQFFDDKFCIPIYADPDDLTHKKPVTIEWLVERFRHVLNKGHMSAWSMAELINIADQLEKLSDSDD